MTERIIEACVIVEYDYPYFDCKNSACANLLPVKLTWRELELGTSERYFIRVHLDGRRCEEDWYEAIRTVA